MSIRGSVVSLTVPQVFVGCAERIFSSWSKLAAHVLILRSANAHLAKSTLSALYWPGVIDMPLVGIMFKVSAISMLSISENGPERVISGRRSELVI